MVCEAFQTNALVAALAAHSAKCCLLSVKTAFTASFAEWNWPMSTDVQIEDTASNHQNLVTWDLYNSSVALFAVHCLISNWITLCSDEMDNLFVPPSGRNHIVFSPK